MNPQLVFGGVFIMSSEKESLRAKVLLNCYARSRIRE